MSALDATMAGRVEAEAIMYDSCVVSRPGEPFTDPDGIVTTPIIEMYAGKCKVQTTAAQANSPVAGGHVFTVENLQLHLPVATALNVDDTATITSSLLDPTLIDLTFRLVELARGSQRTAARWNVELVTA